MPCFPDLASTNHSYNKHSHSSPEVPGMAQGLRTLALAEDSGLLPGIHVMHTQTYKQTMYGDQAVKPRQPFIYIYFTLSVK